MTKKVMMTIRSVTPPSLADLRQKLGLDAHDIDAEFGVIEVDPDEHLYTFLVDASKVPQATGQDAVELRGPYANPKIGTFGPPQSS
jgi:hypothetical protein